MAGESAGSRRPGPGDTLTVAPRPPRLVSPRRPGGRRGRSPVVTGHAIRELPDGRTAARAARAARSGRADGRGADRARCGGPGCAAARRWTWPRTRWPATTGWPGSPGPPSWSSARCPGVGAAKAAQLVAAFELGRRLMADWPAGRWSIRGPHDIAERLILQMGRLEREELRVVILDTKNHVLRVETVYQGNVSVVAGPRRRAVPRRGPAQRRERDPGPQPPARRPDARRRTTCT